MSWDLLIVLTFEFLIAIPLKSTKHYLPIYKYYLHLKVIFTSNLEITIVVCSFPSPTSTYSQGGSIRSDAVCFLSVFFFSFLFLFLSSLILFSSEQQDWKLRASLGSAELLASGVLTLNKLSGSEIIVRKNQKTNSKCLLDNVNTQSKTNKQTKLGSPPPSSPPPQPSVFVVPPPLQRFQMSRHNCVMAFGCDLHCYCGVWGLPPWLGAVSVRGVNQRLNPQETCRGVQVQLERNSRHNKNKEPLSEDCM